MRRVRSRVLQSGALGSALAVLLLAGLLPVPAAAEVCPNQDIRKMQGTEYLPDCMALEVVSPAGKLGATTVQPHVSSDGGRVAFRVRAALADTPGYDSPLFGDWYVADRGGSGWVTSPLSLPASLGSASTGLSNQLGLSPNFGRWISVSVTAAQFEVGQLTVYEGGLGGVWSARSPLMVPLDGVASTSVITSGMRFTGMSRDLSHLFLQPGLSGGAGAVRYLPGDPVPATGFDAHARNAYVLSNDQAGSPVVELLARDADGKAWGGNCGAWVGGGLDSQGVERGGRWQGAVAPDGSWAYFSARADQPATEACSLSNQIRILRREETPAGIEIAQLISSECDRAVSDPGGVCDTADGDDLFQAASVDGSKVYFTTTRQLADSDRDTGASCGDETPSLLVGCDLYLYDAGKPAGARLTQVSAGEATADHPTVGANAAVSRGITALSGDGSRVYFVAGGVLTDQPNPQGDTASVGQPNLYVYEVNSDSLDFVGQLDPGDAFYNMFDTAFDTPQAIAVPGFAGGDFDQNGADGHILVFQSLAQLTSDDVDGGRADIYRYDGEAGTLERVSRAPDGGSDNGPFDVSGQGRGRWETGAADYTERGWVSEDGNAIVFVTPEGLGVAEDHPKNSYLWRRAGDTTSLTQLPAGDVPANVLVAPRISHDGDVIVFQSADALVPSDGDSTVDIYVARVNGGFDQPDSGESCNPQTGGCQATGAAPIPGPGPTGGDSGNATLGERVRFSARALTARQRAALARGGSTNLRVTAGTSGRVAVRGTARIGGRSRTVIAATRRIDRRGGPVPISLSRPARRQLHRSGRLEIRLRVTFSRASRPSTSKVILTKRQRHTADRGGRR